LHQANNRFERRFRQIERCVAEQGGKLHETTLDEMETLWQQVKLLEKKPS
jgi:ATP diphosphatase